MREARVFGALVRVKAEAQLFDATETLKLRRVDQPNYQSALGVIAQRNDVVDGVAINALRQVANLTEIGMAQSTTRAE